MQYEIKAYRAPEGIIHLSLAASDDMDAQRQATEQGYRVIAIQRARRLPTLRRTGQRFSVPLFSQELLGFLDAGLGLVEAIGLLSRKARRPETRKVIETLARELAQGRSFSKALQAQPEIFPSLYVTTVRTSERTGNLIESLQRYLAYHRQLNIVREKILAASVYPALLMSVGVLVILFLMGYVVPRFSLVYEDLGNDLPWLSRMLMHWGHFFSENATLVFIALGALVTLFGYSASRYRTRTTIERLLWSIPAVGERMRLYQLARFTRTLAMLVAGGIPFVTALGMVSDLLHQPALRTGLRQAAQAIKEGRNVSDAFAANDLATEVGIRLIAVGERSGNLGETLERIAKLYDDEVARWVDWFSKLVEPALMMAIGLIIGFIVLLMYLPIFELASSIQ